MSYYSDPTAAKGLSGINREFSRLEKKAERLCLRVKQGKLPREALDEAQSQFTGLYQYVLDFAIKKHL